MSCPDRNGHNTGSKQGRLSPRIGAVIVIIKPAASVADRRPKPTAASFHLAIRQRPALVLCRSPACRCRPRFEVLIIYRCCRCRAGSATGTCRGGCSVGDDIDVVNACVRIRGGIARFPDAQSRRTIAIYREYPLRPIATIYRECFNICPIELICCFLQYG